MGLVNTGIKSTPCVQWNILLYFWCCGPIFLLEVLDILFRHMASLMTLLEILEWAMFGSSNRTIIQTQTSKITQMGHWVQNQASAMAIPVLWPEPCRKWVRWTEEKKHRDGAVNLKDLERFWMKEWSLISCQVFSNLIRHYRRKFRAVKLANGGFKKYWIKGCR